MNTRFFNGKVLTFGHDDNIIENGEVLVQGSEIAFAGEASSEECRKISADLKFDREIDLKGDLIMPGFKNCHTHSAMTIFRSAADDMKLDDWLHNQIFPREACLTADDVYYATYLACLEYLTSGITEICEMYYFPYSVAKAAEEAGIRCVQCGSMSDFSSSAEELKELYQKLNSGNDMNAYRLGIHAEYTNSKENLERVAKLSHELKAPVYMHMSETDAEVKGCMDRNGGMSPVELMDSLGVLDNGGVFFHGVHVTEKDMKIMKERGVSVITNPASNIKLASGIAPIEDYLKKGIRLGIGTDGPASNNCLDMFREMFLTTALAKYRENDAAAVDAVKVLKMACCDGADAIDTPDTDSLAAGKKADLIVIDLHQPNMQPENNIVKNIVYSGSKQNVRLTMTDGIVRYEEGRFNVGIQPSKIYEEVKKTVDRINEQIKNNA